MPSTVILVDIFGDPDFFWWSTALLRSLSIFCISHTHTHIWLRDEEPRKLKRQLVEHGRVIFSLTHIEEVSSQPFANIPRCIALGVMEGLFILAKKDKEP